MSDQHFSPADSVVGAIHAYGLAPAFTTLAIYWDDDPPHCAAAYHLASSLGSTSGGTSYPAWPLVAIQASLTDADVASMTSMYAFLRSFGGVWGVTIPSVIFNGQVDRFLGRISDTVIRQQLADGNAYGFASTGNARTLPPDVRDEVLGVYTDSLKTVWQVAIAFSLVGFLAVLGVKQLDMSRKNETKFGLQEENPSPLSETEKGEKEAKATS